MKKKFKKLIGLVVAGVMLISAVSTVFAASAADFSDFPSGWSKEAMLAAVDNGLLIGYEDNTVRPKSNLTRAEMATIITRSFGAKTTADISKYTDVSPSDWFYDSIAKVVKMGAMQGVSDTGINKIF